MNTSRKFLIAKPEIPVQRVGRLSVFVMPEPERQRGRIERLDAAKPLPLHLVIAALLMGGAVTLTAVILNLAAKAAHFPIR